MSAEIIGSGTTPQRSDTRRLLLVKMVNASGGGGGGSGGVTQGNYGGVQPNFTPSNGAGIAFDNSNGREWTYFGGAWH